MATSSTKMRAVVFAKHGGPEVLELVDLGVPQPGEDQVLIRVEATAVNRLDLYQRTGGFKPSSGDFCCPGIECSGHIIEVGRSVSEWKVGDKVCAILEGGGYAEMVVVPAKLVLPIPSGVSLKDAASLPFAACITWLTLHSIGGLGPGSILLVHDSCGDVGVFAIQMAKLSGMRVFVTTGTDKRIGFYKQQGADICINIHCEDFVARVMEETQSLGVDVILDSCAFNVQKNLRILNFTGVLFLLDFLGNCVAEIDVGLLVARLLRLQVINFHTFTVDEKERIVNSVKQFVWPKIKDVSVKPKVSKTFPLSQAADAHRLLDSWDYFVKLSPLTSLWRSLVGKAYGEEPAGKLLLTP